MTTEQAVEDRPLDTFEMRLYLARWHAGRLNPGQAAARVGVSDSTWRNWEKGLYVDAAQKPWMVRQIAEALGVSQKWLREGGPLRTQETPGPDGPGVADGYAIRDSNPEPADMGHSCPDLQLVA